MLYRRGVQGAAPYFFLSDIASLGGWEGFFCRILQRLCCEMHKNMIYCN